MTALKEMSHGFVHRLDPLVLCSYEVDCDDVVDLTDEAGRRAASVAVDETSCAWMLEIANGKRPASWAIYDRLAIGGVSGILVQSFAIGADTGDRNLVLWNWGPDLPHKAEVYDPSGRLPRNQLSWS